MKNKNFFTTKKFWLQIFLPIVCSLALILGLSIGLYIKYNTGKGATNVTVQTENPEFGNDSPSDPKFNFNSKTFNSNQYIDYWAYVNGQSVHKMVKYDLEYTKTYKEPIKTLTDFINRWNDEDNGNMFHLKSFKPIGTYIAGFKDKNNTSGFLPTQDQTNKHFNYIAITSTTNSNSKNTKATPGQTEPFSLAHTTSLGMSMLKLENNDIFNLINWPAK